MKSVLGSTCYPMQEDRQQIEVQLFGKVERTAVKPLDAAIRRTGSFGKDDDGITSADQIRQSADISLEPFGNRIEFGLTDDEPINRVAVDPVVREHDQFRRQHQNAHQIEVRLVVADDDCGLREIFAAGVVECKGCSRDPADDEVGSPENETMQPQPLFFGRPADMKIKKEKRRDEQKCAEYQKENRIKRKNDSFPCNRHFAFCAVCMRNPSEHETPGCYCFRFLIRRNNFRGQP